MNRIASETELLDCFRPIDREGIELPENLRYPLEVKDYFTWTESSQHRVYLVFADGKAALGVVFRLSSGGVTPAMCEWCHCVRSGDGVALLTAAASDHRRVGLHLCRDLSCKAKLESEPGVNDFPESLSVEARVQRVVRRMSEFARRNLF